MATKDKDVYKALSDNDRNRFDIERKLVKSQLKEEFLLRVQQP
jgi:hypothetical protein